MNITIVNDSTVFSLWGTLLLSMFNCLTQRPICAINKLCKLFRQTELLLKEKREHNIRY